jgi:hypothetical protein
VSAHLIGVVFAVAAVPLCLGALWLAVEAHLAAREQLRAAEDLGRAVRRWLGE